MNTNSMTIEQCRGASRILNTIAELKQEADEILSGPGETVARDGRDNREWHRQATPIRTGQSWTPARRAQFGAAMRAAWKRRRTIGSARHEIAET